MTTMTPQAQRDESAQHDTDGDGTSFVTATRLVAAREMKSFMRMKGFWIGFAVTLIGLFALTILPSVFGGGQTSVAVVGPQAANVLTQADLDVRETAGVAEAEELVRTEEVEAAVVPDTTGESVTGVRVLALSDAPSDVVAALGTSPPVDLLEESDIGQGQQQLVIMVFSLLFLIFAMGGTAIAQSTVTEKQTRIVEILVATVPVRALLTGKIVGHTLLTIIQVVVLAVAAPIALNLGGQSELLTAIAPALGWFVPFLCLGFVLLGAMWAVAGSVVSRQEDLGSTMGLIMMLVMGPYFAVMFFSDNAMVMNVLSYIPFSAAIAMPVRMFTGDAQVWEALLSMGILVGSLVAIVLIASRLYAGSLLHTGGKVSLAKAWAKTD
ncbi:sodium ABC transporter permease [Prauserella marina]|uniref:ABC-2 type transport system permease protein n=1 Tax=Prauserella marina TaxID=530584 RepID=A0A222VVR7_9PSEU|nr:ABC transporter permease [Prauserella marina]ASR38029.1 sodium ABC transporter permease [Prauserella marina]PWV73265.1 ABC-2 type transport system permease protein [Prauserella marina]SDD67815.1 ABC-2 type transport system permease protein [Prauserella marina]